MIVNSITKQRWTCNKSEKKTSVIITYQFYICMNSLTKTLANLVCVPNLSKQIRFAHFEPMHGFII